MSKIPARIGTAVALVLTMLCAFEAMVRFDDWSQFGMPYLSPTNAMTDLFVRDADGPHARPGAQFRQFTIDARGFRGPEVSDAQLVQRPVIVTAGASETFGLYEAAGKEWPRQLADSLASRCGAEAPVVLNSAFVGMTLPTVEADVARRIRRVKPRYVVYYPTPMQYVEGEIPVASAPDTSATAAISPRWRSRALPRVRDAVKRATPERVLDLLRRLSNATQRHVAAYDTVPTQRLDRYETDLRHLVGTVRSIGAEPVLMVHQNRFAETTSSSSQMWLRAWERFYPLATGAVLIRFDSLAGERTRQVAHDSGTLFVDPTALLRRVPVERTFADFSHYSTLGAGIVAGAVSEQMNNVASCTPRH